MEAVYAIVIFAGIVGVVYAIVKERQAGAIPEYEPDEYAGPLCYSDETGKQENVIDGAAHVEARRSGRHLGPDIVVEWTPGMDWEVDNHGRWIERYGEANGITLKILGDKEPLARRRR